MSCLRRNKTCIFAGMFITFAITGSIIGVVVAQQAKNEQQYHDSVLPKPDGYPELSESDRELLESLNLAREINSINSIDEFLKVMGAPQELRTAGLPGPSPEIAGLYGLAGRGISKERSNSVEAKPAVCMPELQSVSLKQDNNTSILYYPSCTRIMRCGGCCTHPLLSCQPTATEIKNFVVISYDPANEYNKQIVPLEEHTSCQCDCTIREKDCTLKQTYRKELCKCECNNVDEMEKCIKDNDTKIWNSKTCDCVCREEKECSTGFTFDQNTCRCRQLSLSRGWFPLTKGADYGFGQTQRPDTVPPVIISLDARDPKRKPKPDPYA